MLKDEILKILLEQEGFLSGQEISAALRVSRTAVWKGVAALRKEGYEILAVNHRGYFLENKEKFLSAEQIQKALEEQGLFFDVIYERQIDSTNRLAKSLAEERLPGDFVFLAAADTQTKGRGRRGRDWSSPAGESISMSLCFRPKISPELAPCLTLLAALAMGEAIEEAYSIPIGIKWPNDLVLHGKKICGILTEMSADLDGIRYVVCGLGVNVNTVAFPEELFQTATSLFLETGKRVARSQIIGAACKKFFDYYALLSREKSFLPLQEPYEKRLLNAGKRVRVLALQGEYEALCLGIDPQGALLVEREGEILRVISGEVSIRGIYGYA